MVRKRICATMNAEKTGKRKRGKPLIYCCKEHIEEELDDAVEKGGGKAPGVDKIVDENQKLSTICEYCTKKAAFIVLI